jgi:hypothetical protein
MSKRYHLRSRIEQKGGGGTKVRGLEMDQALVMPKYQGRKSYI